MKTERLAKKATKPRSPRLPKGTIRNPWYLIPEHYDRYGNLVKAYYEYISPLGVWKLTQLPSTCHVKISTGY